MARQTEEIIEYSEDTQKLLLQFMISNSAAFVRCQQIIDPVYWNERLRPACRYILKFSEKYNILPTPDQIKAETNVAIDRVDDMTQGQYTDWFMETVENFCRHKAMEQLTYDAPELISKGQYAELERRSKENMMISLQKELGTDYFSDPLERLLRMKDRTGMTSTGWKHIDEKLYGGFNRGELTFFAGGPGSGKSLFLQNLALNWVQMGLNVVYITLELSEDLVGLRFDAMISSMPTKQIFRNMEHTALKVGMASKTNKWGKLQIKKLPEGGTTANSIRAYLKEYEIQTGIRPDAICVDYLDLLHPNNGKVSAADLFIKDKYTSEELRGLAAEWNILAATASQLNRASVQEQSFDISHMAGGISKVNTADNVLAIFVTAAMKERGEYQIQFLKTRSSSGVGQNIFLKFDQATLRISDMEEDELNKSVTSNGGFSAMSKELAIKRTTTTVGGKPSLGSTPKSLQAPEASVDGSDEDEEDNHTPPVVPSNGMSVSQRAVASVQARGPANSDALRNLMKKFSR